MSSPSVSVVIPSYNHGRYIGQAVDSVVGSSYPDLELVIVDDGSTDDTLDILKPYRADPRIIIQAQENRGAHAALNVGLALAGGDIVFILNSDDEYHPARIKRIVDRFRADPKVVMVASWIDVMDGDGDHLGVKEGPRNMPPWPPPSAGPLLSELGDLELALLETNFVSTTSNVAFRRSLVTKHGLDFLPLRYTHDWDFILSACRHGSFFMISEPLIRYRVHGANTIREGEQRARGEMRFEVMWSVARHARDVCVRKSDNGLDPDDLQRRMWRSLPRFGCDALLGQLLSLRGDSRDPPTAYDTLLEPGHPFRAAAIETLAAMP